MPEEPILDARLAEIDRRLRAIQAGLAPAAQSAEVEPLEPLERLVPPEPLVPPEAAPVPKRLPETPAPPSASVHQLPPEPPGQDAAELVAELRALLEAHERLLAAARELLGRPAAAAQEASVSLSAGPFAGTDALRRFEQSLRALPEVRRVVLREYEGENRAILDVHLSEPTP